MPRGKTVTQTVRKTKTSKATAAKVAPKRSRKKEEVIPEEVGVEDSHTSSNRFSLNKKILIVLIIVGLGALIYYQRGLFVAAIVNGQPISNLELQQKLNQTYKERTLSQMINETILEQESKKKNITVSDDEITGKMNEVMETYGGEESFNQLLTQQGLTREDFAKQTRLQLLVERLYAEEIKPTDEEIKKFMDDNSSAPEATDEAKFRESATEAVRQDKLSKVFAEKFEELKNNAKIQTF